MKITKLSTYRVLPRWMFVKVDTDEGVTGWGEPVVEGHAKTVEAAVHEIADYVVGMDPRNINDIWQMLYRTRFYRGGPVMMSAIAGVDQALWDIKGKALGVNVTELLGGRCRDKIKCYSWVGGDRPADVIEGIRKLRKIGFDTFKLNGCEDLGYIDTHKKIRHSISIAQEIRDAFGDDIEFALDFHGRVTAPMAKIMMKELEPYHPYFIEEPVLAENCEYYRILADESDLLIAAGERMYTRYDFKRVLEGRGVSILQPDLSHAGGITEVMKIAAMAEACDVALAPHCPLGPVALASCLCVDMACYNAALQEQSMGIHYNQGAELLTYVENPEDFDMSDGYLHALTKPGLGVVINEHAIVEASKKTDVSWHNPVWRHPDGSVSEW
ncbi:MAG: galactonate dehydratase [Succinivibrio sp.]|jgi:galactonate dehydratase|nr:galactonate dehydratase [Succinivibrio sp.]